MTVSGAAAAPVLADIGNTGGAGTLVVLVLIAASIGIFVALVGSLRRLRQNVSDGTFAARVESEDEDSKDGTSPQIDPQQEGRPAGGPAAPRR